jgi:phosphotransferase system HPr (HPr) family protein
MRKNTKVKDIDRTTQTPKEIDSLTKKTDEKVEKKTANTVADKTDKAVKKKTTKTAEKKAVKVPEKVDTLAEKIPAVVTFILVSKIKLCFRECAAIVKVAEDTGCLIEIAAGTKSGTSDSILSLVNLAINVDKSLVLTIHGENNHEAFERVSKILNGKSEETKS